MVKAAAPAVSRERREIALVGSGMMPESYSLAAPVSMVGPNRVRDGRESVSLCGRFHFAVFVVLYFCSIGKDNRWTVTRSLRSEEHTSELQSLRHLVCRLL